MQYLANLVEMGLVERVGILGKSRRKAYRLVSNVMDTFYYLADKHRVDEQDLPLGDVRENLRRSVSRAIERFVGHLFAQVTEGQIEYSFEPEIDFVVTRGRRRVPVVAGEVRWGRFNAEDVKAFSSKVEDLDCRKVFVVPRARSINAVRDVEVVGAGALVEMAPGRG